MKSLLILWSVLWAFEAQSFLNIEALRQNRNPGFKGSTGLRLNGSIGNTDKILGNVQTMNAYRTEKREFLMLMSYEYGSSLGVKNSNKGSFHIREARSFEHFPTLELFAQYQFDEFKRLRSRRLLGTGLREAIVEQESFSLFGGFGAFYEWEELKDLLDENQLRSNLYLSLLYKSDQEGRFGASLILYFQPSFRATEDNRLIIDSGLSFRITKSLSYVMNVGLSRDTRPPPNVRRTDITYLTGITWSY